MKRLKRPGRLGDTHRPRSPWRVVKMTCASVLVASLVLAVAAACLALFSGACKIRKVNFNGNRVMSAEALRQLSGIDGYKNLVTLPVGRIAVNLEASPWIAKAHVRRRLLDTVDIRVDERRPVVMLDYASTGMLADRSGFVMARTPLSGFPELPRVHGGASVPPVVGEKVKDRKVLECVRVLGSMTPQVRGVFALGNPFDGRGQVFITRLGFQVVYGSESDGRKKNEVLWVVVVDVQKNDRKIAYVDVRVPDSPVIRPL